MSRLIRKTFTALAGLSLPAMLSGLLPQPALAARGPAPEFGPDGSLPVPVFDNPFDAAGAGLNRFAGHRSQDAR